MTGKLLSRTDLDFLLYDWLAVDRLAERDRYAEHDRGVFNATIDTCAAIAEAWFKPNNRRVDLNEPRFENGRVVMLPEVADALGHLRDSGMFAAGAGAEIGGLQLPATIVSACLAWFEAGSVAMAAYAFLTIGALNMLASFGSEQQIEDFVRPMVEGRWFGTMCLSEPQAGSSLADIRTRAERQPDGSFRLFGTKMWISGGEHELSENIVHMVLARIKDAPPGVAGISLFVVPKFLPAPDATPNAAADATPGVGERNDVVLAGLNHKMGYRGTTNTLLNFGEGAHTPGGAPGAVGHLVGRENRGLSSMFHMMNEARIAVGRGAVALGYTGYLHALDYARGRPQGRLPGTTKDANSAPVPIIRHADVKRMLLAQKSYVEGGLALILYCARLVDDRDSAPTEDAEEAGLLLDLLTPIAKSWPSQWCLIANDLAIQVHGGYGYTRDYDVEQFWRDNRLNAIHEGTHGVQGLDLLGRKVVMNDGRNLAAFKRRVQATIAQAATTDAATTDGHSPEAAAQAEHLRHAVADLDATTAILHEGNDPVLSLANSSLYLEAFGHIVVAWLWLEQSLATRGRPGDFHEGKRHACRYFFRHELPRTAPQLALLRDRDTTALDMQDAWF